MGRDSKQKKLAVLQVIKEKKNVLFDSFQNNSVSRAEKKEAWKEILKKAHSVGIASGKQEWTYARDHIFGLWKSRTLKKHNKLKTIGTGNGGGKQGILDEVDMAILNILGLELLKSDDLAIIHTQNSSVRENKTLQQCSLSTGRSNRSATKRKLDDSNSIQLLKKQVLESELYKNKLQILQLERELGLPLSKFTKDLQLK